MNAQKLSKQPQPHKLFRTYNVKFCKNHAKPKNGKAIYTIRAEFEVKAPANAPHDKLTDKIKEMLAAAGITNLSKIEVLNA